MSSLLQNLLQLAGHEAAAGYNRTQAQLPRQNKIHWDHLNGLTTSSDNATGLEGELDLGLGLDVKQIVLEIALIGLLVVLSLVLVYRLRKNLCCCCVKPSPKVIPFQRFQSEAGASDTANGTTLSNRAAMEGPGVYYNSHVEMDFQMAEIKLR